HDAPDTVLRQRPTAVCRLDGTRRLLVRERGADLRGSPDPLRPAEGVSSHKQWHDGGSSWVVRGRSHMGWVEDGVKLKFKWMFGADTAIGSMPERLAALEKRVHQLQAELEKLVKTVRATSS